MSQRRVLITGANGNIGSWLAGRFADCGWSTALLYHRHSDNIEKLLHSGGDATQAHSVDLMDTEALADLLPRLSFDSLVHTAGVRAADATSLADSSPADWARVLTHNLVSTANLLRVAVPVLRLAKPGRVVLLGSDVSRFGLCRGSAYAAAKAGIINLARSLCLEEPGLLFNVVSPGPVHIDDSHFSEEYKLFRERYYRQQLERTPTGRLADLDDLWGICRFLVSSDNRHISGEDIVVNGGRR